MKKKLGKSTLSHLSNGTCAGSSPLSIFQDHQLIRLTQLTVNSSWKPITCNEHSGRRRTSRCSFRLAYNTEQNACCFPPNVWLIIDGIAGSKQLTKILLKEEEEKEEGGVSDRAVYEYGTGVSSFPLSHLYF